MNTDSFAQRHIGPRKSDLSKMLKTIGVNSMKELIEETIPENILLEKKLSLDKESFLSSRMSSGMVSSMSCSIEFTPIVLSILLRSLFLGPICL